MLVLLWSVDFEHIVGDIYQCIEENIVHQTRVVHEDEHDRLRAFNVQLGDSLPHSVNE